MLSVAFIPRFYLGIVGNALTAMNLLNTDALVTAAYARTLSTISLYSLLLVAIAAVIWLVRSTILKHRAQRIDATWGCGYTAPTSRLQYTGKSFSKPLGKIFNYFLIEKKHYEELRPNEVFPVKRDYYSHYHDFFERKLINPIVSRLNFSANYFSFIQNGRVQSYVLYGIVFILAIFLLTVFNIVS